MTSSGLHAIRRMLHAVRRRSGPLFLARHPASVTSCRAEVL